MRNVPLASPCAAGTQVFVKAAYNATQGTAISCTGYLDQLDPNTGQYVMPPVASANGVAMGGFYRFDLTLPNVPNISYRIRAGVIFQKTPTMQEIIWNSSNMVTKP